MMASILPKRNYRQTNALNMPARKAWAVLPYNPMPGGDPVPGKEIHPGVIRISGAVKKKGSINLIMASTMIKPQASFLF